MPVSLKIYLRVLINMYIMFIQYSGCTCLRHSPEMRSPKSPLELPRNRLDLGSKIDNASFLSCFRAGHEAPANRLAAHVGRLDLAVLSK